MLKALSCIIRDEVKDPRIDPLLTVTRVEVTPDLQFCKCFVSSLGSDEMMDETIEGLKNAGGFIRRELAHRVNLRKTPEISFIADRNIQYAIEMSQRIEQLAREGGIGSPEDAETEVGADSADEVDY